MAPIEDYGMIGDLQTAALVSRHGSIDWLCLPRFDSGACFAALLGDEENGHWTIQPAAEITRTTRRYRHETLILETELETADGAIRLIDFMPPRGAAPDVVRIVEGIRGRVLVCSDLVLRFDYGRIVPWVRTLDGTLVAIAGPDAVALQTPVELAGRDFHTIGEFVVSAGDRVPFVLTWHPSHEDSDIGLDPEAALRETEEFWIEWVATCSHPREWRDATLRSLITLKGLTYAPTGGIVAAATTSLPEQLGGVRNWDYRFCWLRDATLTLLSLLNAGYVDEAHAWRDWLLRAIAGDPADLQIMYGVAGERRLPEEQLDWLTGYEGSAPVRIGNAASGQLQLDVYGEVADALYQARSRGLPASEDAWLLLQKLLEFLETGWQKPDEGIWEVRGPRRHFTHSKVMAWVAFDRGVRVLERNWHEGPLEKWRRLRHDIHVEVCRDGYDADRGSFVQAYGEERLDASLLMIPLVGFLGPKDPRVIGTVNTILRELTRDGLVERYRADQGNVHVDGMPPGEGVFLPCSFWMAEVLWLMGRREEAVALFRRLLSLRNDLGLLSEEYDPERKRLVGNFPQAFTHVSLVDAANQFARKETARTR